MKQYVLVLGALALLLVGAIGCDSLPLIAQAEPTATPSRTPRPTFTPRATATEKIDATETPEVTDTPAGEATETPEPTNVIMIKTQAPPKPTKQPKATHPPPNTPVPQPQFPIYQDFGPPYKCEQAGVNEVVIYAKKAGEPGHRAFAGGYYFGAFVPGGGILQDGAGKDLIGVTGDEGSISYGSNCQRPVDRTSPDVNNGKLDVNDAVRQGNIHIVIRFIKSPSDFTPISADVQVDFTTAGRWWLQFGVK